MPSSLMKWPKLKPSTLLGIFLSFILCGVGLHSFPLALFGPDRELIPGDPGDSRFNNYILEHFHQYATGRLDNYWDAPFMYPCKNTIAFSDNLLGTAPLYSLFRVSGFNRESAFQLWILSMFALSFICCYLALLRWSGHSVLAACGAYVYAFGIHLIGHMDHAQVFPRFVVPLALWWCWQWLQHGRRKHLFLAALATVYQFYCGIYLGFILTYALLCLGLGHVLAHARHWRRYLPSGWKPALFNLGIVALAVLLMLPLIGPYLATSDIVTLREFDDIKNTVPRPRSYFFTHPAALSWLSLSVHSQYAFDEWWSHFHFMGALPWMALLLLPLALWKSRSDAPAKRTLMGASLALLLAVLFCLRIGDLSLYSLVYQLPGFGALRAIDRFVPVLAFFFALMMVLVFLRATRKPWSNVAICVLLPLAMVIDNKVEVRALKRYNKHAARERVERAVLDIRLQTDSSARAVVHFPMRGVWDIGEDHQRTIELHLTAMLAGQEIGIPVVNAYTGYYPGNHMTFWNAIDQSSLNAWCAFNGITPAGVQWANSAHRPVLRTDTILLRTRDDRYLCIDRSLTIPARADRERAGDWERLVRLHLENGRYAFVAHTDRFLSVELHRDSGLVAVSDRLGDMGIFRMEEEPNGRVAILADNGRYLMVDTASRRLYANADSTDERRFFTLERP